MDLPVRAPRRPASGPLAAPALFALLLVAAPALAGCMDFLSPAGPGGAGDWAGEFLSDDTYRSLTIEVDAIEGHAPAQSAMDLLRQRAEERLRKPDGIELTPDDAIPTSQARWSVEEIRSLEDRHRDLRKEGSNAVLYVLYLDGEFEGGSGVVGLAYSASSFAIFKERIQELSRDQPPLVGVTARDVERSVVVHELGHLLGLVDNGIPMCTPHEDPDHEHHSDNNDSVMFWAVERNPFSNFVQRFDTTPPTQFDSDDICDMRQAGGR